MCAWILLDHLQEIDTIGCDFSAAPRGPPTPAAVHGPGERDNERQSLSRSGGRDDEREKSGMQTHKTRSCGEARPGEWQKHAQTSQMNPLPLSARRRRRRRRDDNSNPQDDNSNPQDDNYVQALFPLLSQSQTAPISFSGGKSVYSLLLLRGCILLIPPPLTPLWTKCSRKRSETIPILLQPRVGGDNSPQSLQRRAFADYADLSAPNLELPCLIEEGVSLLPPHADNSQQHTRLGALSLSLLLVTLIGDSVVKCAHYTTHRAEDLLLAAAKGERRREMQCCTLAAPSLCVEFQAGMTINCYYYTLVLLWPRGE